eukprot:TRINITY_DN24466_c0_g2_i1.p1 TRINITY_DN24466_c0_g2~~TRINITY_DN24466_c0_g2_i1.p1  ORF type:complete len:130 (+),score=23.48 TRINITY_DN24466_c0_g2_i1:101-490(+)
MCIRDSFSTMLQPVLWFLLAALHALPAFALFKPASITSLYGIKPDNPLFLLMQHRAALFLAVFLACIWAAFDPSSRMLAAVVASVSMIGFLALYFAHGSPPAALKKIAVADLAGLPVLAAATWMAFRPV